MTVLGDGKSVDCRVPNKYSDGGKRSKPSGAQFRKKRKEEEGKRVKNKGMHLHSFCMITLSMSSMKG